MDPAPHPRAGLREVSPPEGAPHLVWVDPSSLTPNVANWRIHTDEQRALVGDTINDPDIGWAGTCLYNERTGNLLDGHLRRDHAFNNRLAVPVLVGSWSPEKEATIMITLDQSTGMAQTDKDKLLALFQKAVPPTERSLDILKRITGQKGVVFPDETNNTETNENENAGGSPRSEDTSERERQELLDKWAVEPGSLWLCQSKDGLRIHRLLCGDSTADRDVARLFNGQHADCVVTSPPYGEQRDYAGDMPPWDDLMRGAFTCIPAGPDTQILANLGIIHKESCLNFYWYDWVNWMKTRGWRPFGLYAWDQGEGLPGDFQGRFNPAFELIFHFNKNAIECNKIQECKSAGILQGGHRLRTGSGDGRSTRPERDEIIPPTKVPDSVIRIHRARGQGIAHLHPAIFPVELPRWLMEAYTQPNQNTYDPFGGSGSTLLACEEAGRTGYLMEIHPTYFAIILERLSVYGMVPFQAR